MASCAMWIVVLIVTVYILDYIYIKKKSQRIPADIDSEKSYKKNEKVIVVLGILLTISLGYILEWKSSKVLFLVLFMYPVIHSVVFSIKELKSNRKLYGSVFLLVSLIEVILLMTVVLDIV